MLIHKNSISDSVKKIIAARKVQALKMPPQVLAYNVNELVFKTTEPPERFLLIKEGAVKTEKYPDAFMNAEAGETSLAHFKRRGNDVVFDYEHETFLGKAKPPIKAAGWIYKIDYEPGKGLFVSVKWTPAANELIKNREYRYFSPVYWVDKKTRNILYLESAALTNTPATNNLEAIVNGLTVNSDEALNIYNGIETKKELIINSVTHKLTFNTGVKKMNPEILAILGLKEGATIDEALVAMLSLKDDADKKEKLVAELNKIEAKIKAAEKAEAVICSANIRTALGVDEKADEKAILDKVNILSKSKEDLAVTVGELSAELNSLKNTVTGESGQKLVDTAIANGQLTPAESEKWALKMATENPDTFKNVVSTREKNSVIPLKILPGDKNQLDTNLDSPEVNSVGNAMGVSKETREKYLKKN